MDLLGFRETAERLGIGETLTRDLIYRGELESVKIGKRRLVPSEAIDSYIERLRTAQREAVEA